MENILVVKRNKTTEPYCVAKIKKIIEFVTKNTKANPLELETMINSRVKNKITTQEIQFSLIDGAISLISTEAPDWSLVAGRLEVYNLQREIFKAYKITYDTPLYDFIQEMCDKGLYDKVILEKYTQDEINKINAFLNVDYDFNLNIASAKNLIKKYLIKYNGKSIELPQFANLVTIMFLNISEKENRIENIKKDYEAVASLRISLATPFKANLRKPNANLSSCFILEVDDNSESINHSLASIAEISKNGGGVGIYLGRLRPSNSLVRGRVGANNINKWAKIIDDMSPAWNQCHIEGSEVEILDKGVTKILKIEQVREGDLIKSYDVSAGKFVFNKVEELHIKRVDSDNQIKFKLENGNVIITSKLTRLYSPEFKQYMNACDFEIGDEFLTDDGKTTKIVDIAKFDSKSKFYDFSVKNDENFFVNSILSHNCGVRQGAMTISIDVFHKDIESFIEMKTESGGDIREKCFNIFPQVILNNKFIEAVENNDVYPLLDRHTILTKLNADICNLKDFNDNYDKILELVKNKKLYNCELIEAKKLWKRILEVYVETGELYLVFKENINKTNPFYDNGEYINSANLCLESFSIARPSTNFKTELQGNKAINTFDVGRIHTCNLISLNLSEMKLHEIDDYTRQAVRMLDNAIDLTEVPVVEGKRHKDETRVIGVGVMGLADFLAFHKKSYIKDNDFIESIFERVSYNALAESIELAKHRGSFLKFNESCFAKGKFLNKSGKELMESSLTKEFDWISLLENAKKGVRNAMLVAVAPNTSSSLLCGCSASYLPIFSKLNYETMEKLNIPVVPKYIADRFWYYKEAIHIEARHIVELTNRLTKWIDTGISMELILAEKDNIKELSDTIIQCSKENLKAVYYSRTLSTNTHTCSTCAN